MNTLVAVARLYRNIPIYETADGFEIISADGKAYLFSTWLEACAFVDAWWMLQFVVGVEA